MQRWTWRKSEVVSLKDESDVKKWEFNEMDQRSKFEIQGSKIKFLINTQGSKFEIQGSKIKFLTNAQVFNYPK